MALSLSLEEVSSVRPNTTLWTSLTKPSSPRINVNFVQGGFHSARPEIVKEFVLRKFRGAPVKKNTLYVNVNTEYLRCLITNKS